MFELFLLSGCASGLKAVNIKTKKLIHIANIDHVTDMAITEKFPKAILISEQGKKILQCDLIQLKTRAKASVCLNTGMDYIELNLPFIRDNSSTYSSDVWRFVKIFDNMDRDQEITEPTAIAATHTHIIILQYDVEDKYFKAIRSLDTATPVQSIYFTPFTAIVSSDKFFEIDLNTLTSEEFLDMSDKSLLHALSSSPMNTFQINSQEYLMCFKDFGIFVSEFGCRSRPTELKWTKGTPKSFAYSSSILYVFSEDGIQLIRIHKSYTNELNSNRENEENGNQIAHTFINARNAQFGGNCDESGIYVISSTAHDSKVKQVIRIDGKKALHIDELYDSTETLN